MYADDLVIICDHTTDFELLIRTFEMVTQDYGLTVNLKKNTSCHSYSPKKT